MDLLPQSWTIVTLYAYNSIVNHLQVVQNAAARLLTGSKMPRIDFIKFFFL